MPRPKNISPLEALQALLKHKSEVPKTERLVGSLLTRFGGLDAFTKEFYAIYEKAKPAQKARMMDKMMSLILITNQHTKPEGDLSKASDEDLDQTMKLLVEAVSNGQKETDPSPAGNPADGGGGSGVPGGVEGGTGFGPPQ